MTVAGPPAKRRRLDFSDEFKVIAGKGARQQTFSVPKSVLTKSSDLLQKSCEGEFKDAKAKTIKLPEQHPNIFSVYVQWLYTGELVILDEDMPALIASEGERKEYASKYYGPLFDTYQLADAIQDMHLRNAVTDDLHHTQEVIQCLPVSEQLNHLFGPGREDSMLQRLIVDLFATTFEDPDWYVENQEKLPVTFMAQVLRKLTRIYRSTATDTKPIKLERCHYHEHDEATPRCF